MVAEFSGGLDRVSMCEQAAKAASSGGMHNADSLRATFGDDLMAVRGSENDVFALIEKVGKSGGPKPKVYMACGTDDGAFPMNALARDLFIKNDYDVTWEQGPGAHTWIFWNEYLERAIKWIVKNRNLNK